MELWWFFFFPPCILTNPSRLVRPKVSDGMILLLVRTEARAGHTHTIHVSFIQQKLPKATATAPFSLAVTPSQVLPKVTRLKLYSNPHVMCFTMSKAR